MFTIEEIDALRKQGLDYDTSGINLTPTVARRRDDQSSLVVGVEFPEFKTVEVEVGPALDFGPRRRPAPAQGAKGETVVVAGRRFVRRRAGLSGLNGTPAETAQVKARVEAMIASAEAARDAVATAKAQIDDLSESSEKVAPLAGKVEEIDAELATAIQALQAAYAPVSGLAPQVVYADLKYASAESAMAPIAAKIASAKGRAVSFQNQAKSIVAKIAKEAAAAADAAARQQAAADAVAASTRSVESERIKADLEAKRALLESERLARESRTTQESSAIALKLELEKQRAAMEERRLQLQQEADQRKADFERQMAERQQARLEAEDAARAAREAQQQARLDAEAEAARQAVSQRELLQYQIELAKAQAAAAASSPPTLQPQTYGGGPMQSYGPGYEYGAMPQMQIPQAQYAQFAPPPPAFPDAAPGMVPGYAANYPTAPQSYEYMRPDSGFEPVGGELFGLGEGPTSGLATGPSKLGTALSKKSGLATGPSQLQARLEQRSAGEAAASAAMNQGRGPRREPTSFGEKVAQAVGLGFAAGLALALANRLSGGSK